ISTIEQAIISAKKYGKQVMVDILNASAGQLKLIEALRPAPAYLCVHTSIDQQMKGQKPFAVLGKLRTKIPVAVAGGITTESAALVLRNKGVAIVIVGGGITKEANPAKAAAELKKIMKNKIKLKFAAKSFEKNNEEKINAAKQMKKSGVSTPNISDGMMRSGSLGDFPLFLNREKLKSLILGRAVTVSVPEGDWAKVVEAIDLCKPGQVLVINEIGDGRAVFGGLACRSCVNRKVAAVIVNGAARDVDEIERLGLPVLARKALPNAGEPSGFGKINVPVEINGIRVAPGDLIAIDKSGAVAIPASRAVEYANRALDVKEKEIRIAKEIGKKGTLGNVMNIKKWELSWKKD
ncbi:bifunctional hexulose-6-phosphate synthase/ribonuclease regulator, partial [Candidatus Micrarchaeota archaeon CG_4_10_14_0_2_um_filter_49_7]